MQHIVQQRTLKSHLYRVLTLRTEIRIAVLAKLRGILSQIGRECHRPLVFEGRRIVSRHTIVGQQLQTVDPAVHDRRAQPRLIAHDIRDTHLGIILPADIVAESSIMIDTQAKIQIITIPEAYVLLDIEACGIKVALPFVRHIFTGTTDHRRSIANADTIEHDLMIARGKKLETGSSYSRQPVDRTIIVLTAQINRYSQIIALEIEDRSIVCRRIMTLLQLIIFMSLLVLLIACTIVDTEDALEGQSFQGLEQELLRGLEMTHIDMIIL